MCSITNTKCKPSISRHSLPKKIGQHRFSTLQLQTLSQWLFIKISITMIVSCYENVGMQNIPKVGELKGNWDDININPCIISVNLKLP